MLSGKLVSPRDEEIRGGLKYTWAEGRSKPLTPPTVENVRKNILACWART